MFVCISYLAIHLSISIYLLSISLSISICICICIYGGPEADAEEWDLAVDHHLDSVGEFEVARPAWPRREHHQRRLEGVELRRVEAEAERRHLRGGVHPLQGVTAASSGTHTHAGEKSRRLAWRRLARPSAGCGGYRRGAAGIPAGSP